MRCDEVQKLLIEFIEGDLEARWDAAVREHLAECEACASEVAAFERTRDLLKDDGYRDPPPFYWTRFYARLMARLHGPRRSILTARPLDVLLLKLVPVAVAVLFFGVGLTVGLRPVLDGRSGASDVVALTERGVEDHGPVVSPRSKAFVESGHERAPLAYAAAADTLRPDSFDPATEQPRVILATWEPQAETKWQLGHGLQRD